MDRARGGFASTGDVSRGRFSEYGVERVTEHRREVWKSSVLCRTIPNTNFSNSVVHSAVIISAQVRGHSLDCGGIMRVLGREARTVARRKKLALDMLGPRMVYLSRANHAVDSADAVEVLPCNWRTCLAGWVRHTAGRCGNQRECGESGLVESSGFAFRDAFSRGLEQPH